MLSHLCPLRRNGRRARTAGRQDTAAGSNVTEMASRRRFAVIVLRVPRMASRRDVRAVTAALRDLPGVETIQADSVTASLVVEGTVLEQDVRLMLTELGFSADAQPAAALAGTVQAGRGAAFRGRRIGGCIER